MSKTITLTEHRPADGMLTIFGIEIDLSKPPTLFD